MDEQRVPKVAAGVRIRTEEFGCLAMGRRTPLLEINQAGSEILRLIDGQRSVGGIIDAVLAQLDLSEESRSVVKDIVVAFLTECKDKGLLAD